MFDANSIYFVLNSLLGDIDLGFAAAPMLVLISAAITLFGLGFKKSWMTFSGVFVVFSYYFLQEMADFGLLDVGKFS